MKISPLGGKPAPSGILVHVSRLVTACYTGVPDATVPSQSVIFGTSGHPLTNESGGFVYSVTVPATRPPNRLYGASGSKL